MLYRLLAPRKAHQRLTLRALKSSHFLMTLTQSQHFSRDFCHQRKTFRTAAITGTRDATRAIHIASNYDVYFIFEYNHKPTYIRHVG